MINFLDIKEHCLILNNMINKIIKLINATKKYKNIWIKEEKNKDKKIYFNKIKKLKKIELLLHKFLKIQW